MVVAAVADLKTRAALQIRVGVAPVRVWAALRPSAVESRFDALHASGLRCRLPNGD
jgi:hypothetical protein